MKSKVFCALSLLLFGISFISAQQSCYEQYLRAHNMALPTDSMTVDDSYDELKKEVIARQLMRNERTSVSRPFRHPIFLAIDTLAGTCHLLAEDGTILADVHLAMVDSTWYMWLSVDPLADKNIANTPYMYCSGNPIVRIDPDGCIDGKMLRTGALAMLGGVGGFVTGMTITVGSEGIAAAPGVVLMIDGFSEAVIGLDFFVTGLLTDPCPANDRIMENTPLGITSALGRVIDLIGGYDAPVAETLISIGMITVPGPEKVPGNMNWIGNVANGLLLGCDFLLSPAPIIEQHVTIDPSIQQPDNTRVSNSSVESLTW